jgi:citrate synthase
MPVQTGAGGKLVSKNGTGGWDVRTRYKDGTELLLCGNFPYSLQQAQIAAQIILRDAKINKNAINYIMAETLSDLEEIRAQLSILNAYGSKSLLLKQAVLIKIEEVQKRLSETHGITTE